MCLLFVLVLKPSFFALSIQSKHEAMEHHPSVRNEFRLLV